MSLINDKENFYFEREVSMMRKNGDDNQENTFYKAGPALKQRNSHHDIHEASLREAESITFLLRQMDRQENELRAVAVAEVLLEHWKSRVLAHATAEEQGWYLELQEKDPGLASQLVELKRDHQLMGELIDEIEGLMNERRWQETLLDRFITLLQLNRLHSQTEEEALFALTKSNLKDTTEEEDHPFE
jgi:hypothetical protein